MGVETMDGGDGGGVDGGDVWRIEGGDGGGDDGV